MRHRDLWYAFCFIRNIPAFDDIAVFALPTENLFNALHTVSLHANLDQYSMVRAMCLCLCSVIKKVSTVFSVDAAYTTLARQGGVCPNSYQNNHHILTLANMTRRGLANMI
jgi:hypothetical protein